MSDAQKDDVLLTRVKRLSYISRAQLIWERFAPVLALGIALVIGFLALSFAGVWQYVGDPWRLIALIISLVFLTRAAWHAQKLDLPSPNDAKRRIELDSGLKHRPLDIITDRPALNAHETAAWANHMKQARQDADRAERPIWRAVLAPRDPYLLRFILPICLMAALFWGLGDNRERLRHAISPSWQNGMASKNVSYEAWIDPPSYTGRPPIYFKSQQFVEIPEGSTLVTRINGLKTVPRLKLALKGKTRYISPKRLGPRLYETRQTISKSGTTQYRLGLKKQVWGLSVILDTPPIISIDEPPAADKRDRLVVTYSLNDDYGVEDLQLVMERLDGIGGLSKVTMPIPKGQRKANGSKLSLDLTKHLWASRKVTAYLEAIDGYGHKAVSAQAYFTIPDKIFVEPLAKAIIENRQLILSAAETDYQPPKQLTRNDVKNFPVFDQYEPDFRLLRAAPNVQRAVSLLDVITDQPAGYYEDPALFMGLNFIKAQIQYADEASDIAGIPEELWRAAIRAEFGTLGTALEEMREAERALREAISRRAPQREITTLFDRYNGAVDNYLEELRRKALENPPDESQQGGGEGQGTNQDEIQELLKAIEEANRIGDVDGARKALARLAELLENLEINLQPGGGGGGGEPQEGEISEELQDSLEELAELLGEQRELKSDTERREREAQRGEEDGQDAGEENGQQPGEQDGQQSGEESGETGRQSQGGGESGLSAEELRERQQALSERLAELQAQLEDLEAERQGAGPEEDNLSGLGDNETNENSGGGGGGTEQDKDSLGGGADEGDSVDDKIGRALEAMRQSNDALGAESFADSLEQMERSIAALRDAGNRLAEEAANRENGEDRQGQQAENGEDDDPFGRGEGANGGSDNSDSQVDLDNKNRQKRARELLEELRNRAAEEDRDKLEKEYLERLLKQF